jgi:hypothetical protein
MGPVGKSAFFGAEEVVASDFNRLFLQAQVGFG